MLMLVALLVTCMAATQSASMAQTTDTQSTPETQVIDLGSTPAPSTGERGSTSDRTDVPQFGLVAVGDHPTGYFDDIIIEPGTSVELTVAVANTGTVPVKLHTYKVNAGVAPNGGFSAGKEDDVPSGPTEWIDYPSSDLELAPGQQMTVTFTVSVPADTSPGQYLSGLAVVDTETAPIQGVDILTQTRGYVISVGILVPGALTQAFEFGEPHIVDRVLLIPVTNTGNYLVKPLGELTLTDAAGNTVQTSPVRMGSVYAGLSTEIQIYLPDQLAAGEYNVDLSLTDEASGASAEIVDAPVTLAEPVDPMALTANVTVEPNADPIAFANVTAVIDNPGREIPAANVSLVVLRDGQEIENFPIASNLLVQTGEATVTARYIPEDAWTPGTYTFQVVVSSVSQREGTETVLLTVDVDGEIVIP
jgi:hypothetical protein